GFEYAFTPDGKRVLYRSTAGAESDLFSTQADGSQPAVRLSTTATAVVQEFQPAPDSAHVVWIETQGNLRELWSAPVTGGAPAIVLDVEDTTFGATLSAPRVTPDSTRVVYLAGSPPELRISGIDASGYQSLSGAGHAAVAFDLTPDGSTAVYWGDEP